MNVATLLLHAAQRAPDNAALARGNVTIHTYGALFARVTALAGGLRSAYGLKAGDRVALAMTNCIEYPEILLACWHAGLCAVPLNARLHAREFEWVLQNAGASLCFTTPELESTLAAAAAATSVGILDIVVVGTPRYERLVKAKPVPLEPVAATDPAWLFYTSGTTGRPKGATLTHRNLYWMTMGFLADTGAAQQNDALLHVAPLSHAGGMFGLAYVARAECQVVPESGGFDPDEIVAMLRSHQRVSFFAVPTMIRRLLDSPEFTSAPMARLGTLFYGGGPMYVSDLNEAIDVIGGAHLWQGYGQGESPCTITHLPQAVHCATMHPDYEHRLATVGYARTGVGVKVVDPDGKELPAGEVGEVVVSGDVVMRGYWQNPDATAVALRDGWLHTGDLGAFDLNGFLRLRDRSKDLIISGGSNVYPREIEEVLLLHPEIRECAVVGRPNRKWGEEIIAFVATHSGDPVSESELDTLCLSNLARYKRPREYRAVDTLPKSSYGKVLKSELRRLLELETKAGK